MCFDIEPVELEGPESSRGKIFLMNFMTFTVYLILVLPLPLTLATSTVLYVSQFDVAYYERHCHHYFSRDCPVHDHDSWICSKLITNCTSPDYPYHCILNTALKVVHVCAATQICHKGTVPIFNPRTYTVYCEKCQKGYYQPYEIFSDKTPVCMQKFGCDTKYHKIECPVEPEKEQTQDTLCRCDARNDYILSNSEWSDTCVPGKYADCFEWKCPDGQERLLNYTCAPRCKEGFHRDDSDICVPRSTVVPVPQREKASTTSTTSFENSSKGNNSGNIYINSAMIAIIVTAVSVAIILLGVVVGLACWRWKKYQNAVNRLRRQSSRDQTGSNDIELQSFNQVQAGDPELGTTSHEKLHRTVLYRCLPELMKDLDVKVVMTFIQQKELFDTVTIRDISEQGTTSDAISMIIQNIQRTSRDKYEEFKDCLALARQKHLIKMLEKVEAEVTKEIKETHQAQVTGYESLDMDVSLPGNSLDAI